MIESQKQYEETLDFLKINRFAYDEANEIDDLIEALREVAKAAKNVSQATEYSDNHWRVHHHDMGPMRIFLEALPDWIKEDG